MRGVLQRNIRFKRIERVGLRKGGPAFFLVSWGDLFINKCIFAELKSYS